MKMPHVTRCTVSQCAYNEDATCHAMAITVGDKPDESKCDTFIQASIHGGFQEATAGVGACKASDCRFNEQLACSAPNIQVGIRDGISNCLTFSTG